MSDFAKSLRDGPTPTKKPPTSARRERDASSSAYTDMDPPMSARKLSYKSSQPTSASKTAATVGVLCASTQCCCWGSQLGPWLLLSQQHSFDNLCCVWGREQLTNQGVSPKLSKQ